MASTGTLDRGRYEEETRPVLRAETLTPAARYLLLALTLTGAALTAATIIAVAITPHGVFELGTWGVAMIGVLLMLIWLLQLVFGALLENNRALETTSHRAWIFAFVVTGPFGLLAYWLAHVWRAPYEARD